MKKCTAICLAILCMASFQLLAQSEQDPVIKEGFSPGLYLGVQGGYSFLHYGTGYLTEQDSRYIGTGSTVDSGFAARVVLGFNFTPYFATEFGVFALPTVRFKNVFIGFGTIDEISFSQYGSDLLAKVTYPFNNGFGIFVKGGPAYVYRDDLEATLGGRTITSNYKNRNWVPAAGLGISYIDGNKRKGMGVDLSYLRYFGQNDLQPIDMCTVGFSYTF